MKESADAARGRVCRMEQMRNKSENRRTKTWRGLKMVGEVERDQRDYGKGRGKKRGGKKEEKRETAGYRGRSKRTGMQRLVYRMCPQLALAGS